MSNVASENFKPQTIEENPPFFCYANKNYKDEIVFRKKMIDDYNTMFWSTPDEVTITIERIIIIALVNNSSFDTIMNLFLYFGEKNMIDSISVNKDMFIEEDYNYIVKNIALCKEFSIKRGILWKKKP